MDNYLFPKKEATVRIPQFSRAHNVIPKRYVQEWKTDMQNRELIIQNCRLSDLPHFEHDDALFLNNREQLSYNVEDANRVNSRYHLPARQELLHPPSYHPTSRYRSSLQQRDNKDLCPQQTTNQKATHN